ncbi:MAG: hypothetical protein R3Y05_05685 [bacterium]
MKQNYCITNYNILTNKWNVILETALLKDFLEFDTKNNAIKYAKMIAFDKKTTLYIYNKKNQLVIKREFI